MVVLALVVGLVIGAKAHVLINGSVDKVVNLAKGLLSKVKS